MKKTIFYTAVRILLIFILSISSIAFSQNTSAKLTQAPFHQGVNMTIWFESWSKGTCNLNYYDKTDLENVKALGADVIRLPIHFDNLSSGSPDYIIDSLTWKHLDQVVDWCEELQLYLIIDNHSFNGVDKYPNSKVIANELVKIWPQIAERYKGRSNYILYEILNEPNEIDSEKWNKIQGDTLKLIRTYDTKHTVVVTGAEWGGAEGLRKVRVYDDPNLIYTFHFYSPYVFTHQGASWAGKEESLLSSVPFPYDKSRMPALPKELQGTEIESELKTDYPVNSTINVLRSELQIAYDFSKKNNVPVWCGEMGAYYQSSLHEDRVRWYETTAYLLQQYNIPFTVWGLGGGFGLYKKNSDEQFPYDLDTDILSALKFSIPKNAGTNKSESTDLSNQPIIIYDDIISKGIRASDWGNEKDTKELLWECTDSPASGNYCIRWGNCARYTALNFNLRLANYLNSCDKANTYISLKIRTTSRNHFDIRLVDSETENAKPWRLSYTLTSKDYIADGNWHTIFIPLSAMKETGAWSSVENKWYNSENKFDWSSISTLQFTSEHSVINGDMYIDDIKFISTSSSAKN